MHFVKFLSVIWRVSIDVMQDSIQLFDRQYRLNTMDSYINWWSASCINIFEFNLVVQCRFEHVHFVKFLSVIWTMDSYLNWWSVSYINVFEFDLVVQCVYGLYVCMGSAVWPVWLYTCMSMGCMYVCVSVCMMQRDDWLRYHS